MKKIPSITVITVVYNAKSLIEATMKSVLQQTYTSVEYIIIDGASTDGTIQLIDPYRSKLAFFVSEKDKGIYDAMNKGIKAATGDVVGILNSDDQYIDEYVIEKIIYAFINDDIDSLYTDLYIIDDKDEKKIIRDCKYTNYKPGMFLWGWHPPHPTFFVKRTVYLKYGYFNMSFKIASDYEFMLRVIEKNRIKTKHISIYSILMRNGGISTSSFKNIFLSQKECIRAMNINNIKPNYVKYYTGKYIQKLNQYSLISFIRDLINKTIK